MKKNTKHFPFLFLAVFLTAFLLRALLINWTLNFWSNGDVTRYEDWARIAHTYGYAQTYKGTHNKTVPNDEPPGTLYALSATYETYILEGRLIARLTHTSAGSILWVNTFLQHGMMKMLPFATDFLIGIFLYLTVKKYMGNKRGILAAALFLLNPVTIYNSAIWGQMDSVNNFFFFLALFFAFRKNIIFSLFAFALSLYIKLSLLPLLPFYIVFLYFVSGKQLLRIGLGILISIACILIFTIPIAANPLSWLIVNLPPLSGGELQNMTNAALNFWWAVSCLPHLCTGDNIPLINQTFLGITLNTWGYTLFGIFTLPLFFFQIKMPEKMLIARNAFLVFSLVALCTFLFLPKMHDRYMYPVIPLLAGAAALSKPVKSFFILFCALSLLHFINLVYSWYPTAFPLYVFYQILYNNFFRWAISALTVVTAGVLYWKSIRIFTKEK